MNMLQSFKKVNFKLLTVLLGLTVFIYTNTLADEFNYSDSWGKQGFELTKQQPSGVEVNYSINSFAMSNGQFNGESMAFIELPGILLPNNEGAPNLPGTGRYIALPQGAKAEVRIIASRTETFTDVNLSPAPRIPWDTENDPLEYNKDMKIYSKNAFYPENPVSISEVTQIRGVDAVILGITPFQYNPVTKELIVYRDLQVQVTFTGGTNHFGEDRLRSRWWDPIMSDMFLNYESLPKMDYSKSFQLTEETGCEYLIITPNDAVFQQWADSIKQFRTLQGILTDIVTIDDVGGNNANTIENYIDNAYDTWDIVPAACLLLADYGTNANNSIISPIYNNYCASDNILADVSGNSMPDIVFARMTAQNATHLEIMVTKFLDYERTPPTNPYFYNNPITALGFQSDRWFQICSETVAGFWEVVQGRTTTRINVGPISGSWSTNQNTPMIMDVFGPDGLGYIPATPGEVNCSWNGSANDVINAVNSGAFMLQHRDHGGETGWSEPNFSNSNIDGFNNTDLTFVWSINCLTGKYNWTGGECFAEKFHRYTSGGQNSGALGIVAASEVSYSFVNDTYVWGAYDNMWPDFLPEYGTTPDSRDVMPAFGNAAGKYFLQQSSWPYNVDNKEVTYNLFHHHGDAFMTVYSEVPQELTVTHNPILYAGVTSFNVTADEGAFIALTVDGEIIGTAEATGAPVSIEIPGQQPPDQMLVVITKQNYYRYQSYVEIIPPVGPYVVQESVELNDEAGNGNGIMETGEAILANLTLENVGVEDAENVSATISSEDEYVAITDNNEDYGTIAAGTTASVEDGFAWDVADNIPDMHSVVFEVNATDGNDTWTTYFSVVGHAPSLEVGSLTIDDSEGNGNGRLDPGETADIIIQAYNNGSYDAMDATGTLNSSSGYLTLNNATYDFNTIEAGLMAEAVFNVTASAGAPIGTVVDLLFDVTSGEYNAQGNFAKTIGLILEDWESGNMEQFNWQTGGTANWAVSQESPYEGTYCIKSGDINDNQNTWLKLDYDVFSNDSISFWYKTSTESGWDYFRFYIDNTLKDEWSGTIGWQRVAYAVSAGEHTFKWQYDKDGSVSSGSDCAWVDFIILPPSPMTTAYAGQDAGICEGDDFQCEGNATLYDDILWTSSGTGSFDDNQSLTPVYTPSTDDINNGDVVLTITAYGPSNDVTDDMTLTINSAIVAFAGDDDSVCEGSSYELANASAENYVSVEWATAGDGTFDDTGVINPVYTPGENDITAGTATLTFTASGDGSCPEVTSEIALSIEAEAVAFAGEDNEISNVDTYIIEDATAENYSSVLWETSGDGTFDDSSLVNPTYSPGSADIENLGVTLTMNVAGNSPCADVTDDMLLTIHISGIHENFGNFDISVFPNPNTGQFTFEVNGETNEVVSIRMYNSLSEVVYEAENVRINKTYTETLNLDIDQGVYYLRIKGKNLLINKKIIISK